MEKDMVVYEILNGERIVGTFQFKAENAKQSYSKYPLFVEFDGALGRFFPLYVHGVEEMMEKLAAMHRKSQAYAAFNCKSSSNELSYVLSLRNGELELVDQFGKVCIQRKFTGIQKVEE